MPKKYETADKYEALRLYEVYDRNVQAVSRCDGMPSDALLYKWRDQGEPTSATGGDDWDTYLDERQRQAVERSKEQAVGTQRDTEEFYDEQRGRLEKLLDHIYEGILSGDVEVKGKDLSKFLADYMTLDNRKADQIEWARETFNKMIQAVKMEVDDDTFERIRNRFMAIEQSQREKLGKLPNKKKFVPGA